MSLNTPNIGFIVYDNRSGSTYLSALLDNFPDIGVSLESPILFDLLTGKEVYKTEADVDYALNTMYSDWKFKEWNVPSASLRAHLIKRLPLDKAGFIYLTLREYFISTKPHAQLWLYKNPNPYLLRKSKHCFPDSKVIFIYRDGRAVFSSKRKAFSKNVGDVMEKNPARAAKTWSRFIDIIHKMEPEVDVLKVKYEELISNTEEELRRIYYFLFGKEPSRSALLCKRGDYVSRIPVSQRYLHPNVTKAPVASRIDAWKNELSVEDTYLFEKTAHRTLLKMGYQVLYYRKGMPLASKPKILLYSVKSFLDRIMWIGGRLIYAATHPLYMWRRLIVKLETRL